MNNGKYVFAQLTEFLPKRVFDRIVARYDGDKYVRHFSCWNQMLCMIFGQFTSRDSLRDLIVTLEAHSRKTYHLGFGKSVTRSNLAKANEKRDCKIFEEFAYHLIELARRKRENDNFEIKGKIYAFDSSTIDLCLSVFWLAKFRKTKGGIKLHTLYDITTQIPAFIHITAATVNDINAMDYIPYESGAYYIFDRGYIDYKRLYKIALLYKNRWQVELFFKWIKQHLKIKSVWGTSENAVRIQIYTAIIAYCLVAIVGHDLNIDRSTYEILQILGISLLDKTPVIELFTNIDYQNVNERKYKQLSLSLF